MTSTVKLTPAQKRGLEAVALNRVWWWPLGGWGQSHVYPDKYTVRTDVLRRLRGMHLIELGPITVPKVRTVLLTAEGERCLT